MQMIDDRPKTYSLSPKDIDEYQYDIDMNGEIDTETTIDKLVKEIKLPKYIRLEKHNNSIVYKYERYISGTRVVLKKSTNLDYVVAFAEIGNEIVDKIKRRFAKVNKKEKKNGNK